MSKVVLIDGNSLVYRAFYALPTTLTLKSGQVTNAVYGFTSMLIRLLIDERPDAVAVAFDSRGPTWRHGHYEGYKANRQATPDELTSQFPLVREILGALAIPVFELQEYEADDILATLSSKARAAGNEVLVVTGDRDAFQLVEDRQVRVMTTRKGITDIVVYDRQKVIERYGVTPEQVPDFLGLKGDASDSIPGVPGIGDKTAAKLIQEFGTVEGIYEHLPEIAAEKLRRALGEHRAEAEMSKRLALLNKDLPLELDVEEAAIGGWDEDNVREVFSRLEFRTLLERFEAKLAVAVKPALAPLDVEMIEPDPRALIAALEAGAPAELGVAALADAAGRAVGVAFGFTEAGKRRAVAIKIAELAPDQLNSFRQRLRSPDLVWTGYDVKEIYRKLEDLALTPAGEAFDPMLAAYLLAPTELDYGLEHLCHRYLKKQIALEGSLAELAAIRAAAAGLLKKPLRQALEKDGLTQVFYDIELPLSRVLARMEACGVGLDKEFLRELSKEMKISLDSVAGRIYHLAGAEFNINSPSQVASILFDKLGLTPGRKTKAKAAYATDAATLAKLAPRHEIVPLILEYRELFKLKSTYIDALPKLIDPATGRLHTTFNQAVTATGRLSSSNPNLQNIPVRTELGRLIRQAFVPAHKDEKLLSADYSQIELRLLAHLSGDAALKRAFAEGADIHAATAAEVFEVDPGEVTPELRRHAKAINFGIIYGMSPYGLSQQLGITPEEAKDYINRYFGRYPAVRVYLEKTVKDAHRLGYVKTITGRKRYMPELKSSSWNERSFGERVAANAPLQGGAADIIKLAMIDIDRYLAQTGLQTRMVLQVHDELVFEVPPLEESAAPSAIKELMEKAYPLTVPLEVNLAFGRNWGEAK